MKKLFLIMAVITALSVTSCSTATKKSDTKAAQTENVASLVTAEFGVRGNCDLCKAAIEKAAQNVKGVKKAVWNVDAKRIDVTYDSTAVNLMDVHRAIAAAGYDTDQLQGDSTTYNALPQCCHYDHAMPLDK